MGKVIVTQAFKWAPDGIRVAEVEAGAIVDGRCAEVAMQLGCGRPENQPEHADAPPAPAPTLTPAERRREQQRLRAQQRRQQQRQERGE